MSRILYLFIVVIALIGGAGLAAQPGVNGMLGRKMAHPLHAAIISFATGLLVLVLIAILCGKFPPKFTSAISEIPWWAWAGGSIGAYLVSMSLVFAPRIGALNWIALIVTGQAITSLLLDHFGIAGFSQKSVTLPRVIGACLLIVGLILSSLDLDAYRRPAVDSSSPVGGVPSDESSAAEEAS